MATLAPTLTPFNILSIPNDENAQISKSKKGIIEKNIVKGLGLRDTSSNSSKIFPAKQLNGNINTIAPKRKALGDLSSSQVNSRIPFSSSQKSKNTADNIVIKVNQPFNKTKVDNNKSEIVS